MTEAVQISQTAPERISMNYAALREGGMELIRTLARDTWTDHNAHDPGITLLEAFSYAMTELGFRIQLEVPDLLQSGACHVPPDLVPVHHVLPCAPVTPRDLRAVLLDHRLLRDARIIVSAGAETPYYEIPHGDEIPDGEVPLAEPPFAYAPNTAPVVLRGLYGAVLEFAERELNSNTYSLTVLLTVDGSSVTYTLDLALPHWDEDEAKPFQDSPVINGVTMLADGGTVWRPLEELQSYFGEIKVDYTDAGGATSAVTLWVLLRITDALPEPALVTPGILAAAQEKVERSGADSLIDRFMRRACSAHSAVQQVRRYLSTWRNLGEDPVRIAVARVQEIAVRARIEVNGSADLEQLLAEIFLAIDRMLAPPVRFVALAERRASGAGVEHIFDGPLLRNGFLDYTALAADDARAVHVSDILRLITRRRNVAGADLVAQENPSGRDIVAVTDLALSNYINNRPITVDAQDCLHLVEIERYRPRLSLSKSRIVFVRNEAEVHYDMGRVEGLFTAMQQVGEAASLPADPSPVWPVASGEALPVEDYTPLQNDLPRIYGVGEARLPEDVGVERQAAVLQLKGYLLLFEQFLADLTVQLGNINHFFSADPDEQETYFCRALFELPDVQKLLTRHPPGGDWAAFIAAPDNPYRSALHQAQEGPERFLDRRNRMFDHLLARQGEEMVAFGQELHRYAQKELQEAVIALADLPARMEARRQAANARLIRAKAALLRDAPMLNHARLQAFGNPLQRRDDVLRIDRNGPNYRWTLVLAAQEQLRSTTDFTTAAAAAIAAEDAAVLAAQAAWYTIASAGGGRRRYCLQDGSGASARVVGESPQTYPSVAAAQAAALSCEQGFAALRLAESLTPLERRIAHLCGIRSRVRRSLITESDAFFEIYDEVDSDGIIEKRWRLWEQPGYGGRVMLSSVYHYEAPTDGEAIDMAKISIQEVVRYGQDEWNYAVATAGTATYNFELWHPAGTKLGLRNPPFLSGEASQQGVEETLAHLYHFYSAEGFHLVEHLLLRPRQNGDKFLSFPAGPDTLERDPYSQRLSLVFPSGYMRDFSLSASSAPRYDIAPHRFRDAEFRRHVERMVQQSCPAHLLPSIFWVDRQVPGTPEAPNSFDGFEQRYFAWLGTVLVPGAAPGAMRLAREDLIEALNGIAHG
jgi:hypothetical protein